MAEDGRETDTTWRSYLAELPAWAIVLGALAVSFWTQVNTVREHGLADWESLIWSGSTDAGTVAFLFLAREGSHRGMPTWGAWLGSVACAAMSVQYNVVHAVQVGDWLAVEAHLWMPALALGTWYWLLHGRHRRWVGWTGRHKPVEPPTPEPATVTVERVPDTWRGVRSADGQWWWDGGQWLPVPAPVPEPDPLALSTPAAPARPVATLPEPRRPGPPATAGPRTRTEALTDEGMAARVATLASAIREARANDRPVSVYGLSKATGIPRTTTRRLVDLAMAAADADPLSTFRHEPAMSGQEAAA